MPSTCTCAVPSDARVEELVSHCFQTVGHNAVEAYGELTGLPLFRRRLRGASRHTEMTYEVGAAECAGDEVEDLRALLAAVVAKMPSVRAVSAGAILSDYQRLRVEAVCSDLGLVSLAYLWQQPQSSVLDLICDSHVHAVLVHAQTRTLLVQHHVMLAAQQPRRRQARNPAADHGDPLSLKAAVLLLLFHLQAAGSQSAGFFWRDPQSG